MRGRRRVNSVIFLLDMFQIWNDFSIFNRIKYLHEFCCTGSELGRGWWSLYETLLSYDAGAVWCGLVKCRAISKLNCSVLCVKKHNLMSQMIWLLTVCPIYLSLCELQSYSCEPTLQFVLTIFFLNRKGAR